MGYGMARNIREKVGKETTLIVCDLNQEAIDRFKTESSDHGPIEIVKNGFEAIQKAVSERIFIRLRCIQRRVTY